jgi:hypothetical protein
MHRVYSRFWYLVFMLDEIREIKIILAKLIGTSELPPEHRFSEEALNKAAKDFRKMSIERGEWVTEDQIGRYIKPVPWKAGAFIREEFGFSNWFKKGHECLYSKKDLEALAQALTARNIDLKRYKEFLEDKAAFDKKVAKDKPKQKPFQLPKGLKNIATSEIPKPSADTVKADITRLKLLFKASKFEAYIDVYKGTYAMLKSMYHFQKYLEPGLKNRCRHWCEDFNYANNALSLITGKKEKFIVVDPATIQL